MLLSDYVKDVMRGGCYGELLIPDDVALLFCINGFMRPVDLEVSLSTECVLMNRDPTVGPCSEWTSTYVFMRPSEAASQFSVTRKACFNDIPVSGYSGTGHDIDALLSVSWQLKFDSKVFNTNEFEELLDILTKKFD